jgi:hypothetical protein
MAYRFKPGRSIEREARRIAGKELGSALHELDDTAGPPSDASVHRARRHVKKVRALIRLVRPARAGGTRVSQARLRAVVRLIAPLCDAESLPDTLARLEDCARQEPPRPSLVALEEVLARRRATLARDPRTRAALRTSARLLRAEQREVLEWRLDRTGGEAVERGLARSVRRGRRSLARVIRRPTARRYDRWRRRVKDYWLQLRLVEERTGELFVPEERRLEALDGLLGEQHNVVLLQAIVAAEASLPRNDRAVLLQLMRRYRRHLEHRALALGTQIYAESPRGVARRMHRAWRATPKADQAPPPPAPAGPAAKDLAEATTPVAGPVP